MRWLSETVYGKNCLCVFFFFLKSKLRASVVNNIYSLICLHLDLKSILNYFESENNILIKHYIWLLLVSIQLMKTGFLAMEINHRQKDPEFHILVSWDGWPVGKKTKKNPPKPLHFNPFY